MYFVNGIRFGETKVLIQIIRQSSRKSDIDETVFQSEPSSCSKNDYKIFTSPN